MPKTPQARVSSDNEASVGSHTIAIIGHGFSGRELAKTLLELQVKGKLADYTVTVIEPNSFYESDIAMPFALKREQSHYETNACAPAHQLKINGVNYIHRKVSSVIKTGSSFTLDLDDGETLVADFVVACSGFSVGVIKPQVGQSFADRKEELSKYRDAIRSAKNVVISGGGAVAVDIGGHVREMLGPGATLHHVISDTAFLTNRHSQKERDIVTAHIKTHSNVKVISNDRISCFEASFTTRSYSLEKSGGTIEADVYIPGFAQWRASFLPPAALTKSGMVDVDPTTLMCRNEPNLFAIGCSNNGEMTAIPKIEGQVKTVAANISCVVNGKPASVQHKEAAPPLKSEAAILYGEWGMIATDKLGCVGQCCNCCGFPFPCCLMPCLPQCGLCGNCCMKPTGKGPAGFFTHMFSKGPFGPVLSKADTKAPVPDSMLR